MNINFCREKEYYSILKCPFTFSYTEIQNVPATSDKQREWKKGKSKSKNNTKKFKLKALQVFDKAENQIENF